jgi:nucleoside 2-deoxyribosyltransferase
MVQARNEYFVNFYEIDSVAGGARYDFLLGWKSSRGVSQFKGDTRLHEQIFNLAYNRVKLDSREGFNSFEELKSYVNNTIPKYTPNENQNQVLNYIFDRIPHLGGECSIRVDEESEFIKNQHWRKFYFVDPEEFSFYLKSLKSSGYLDFMETDQGFHSIQLTVEGLERIVQFQEIKNSRYCFVAMSFDDSLRKIYSEAIKPAIEATGFLPLIVSEVEKTHSETTINDTIIASIKKARFTIADFTQHKNGVYFEAGYALGRGQHVVYTCKTDEIADAHFDTRNYKHLTWATPEELKSKLIDHIRANIDGAKLE